MAINIKGTWALLSVDPTDSDPCIVELWDEKPTIADLALADNTIVGDSDMVELLVTGRTASPQLLEEGHYYKLLEVDRHGN